MSEDYWKFMDGWDWEEKYKAISNRIHKEQLQSLKQKIAELVSKFKESEKNTDDWTIKVDKKYKELEQKIDELVFKHNANHELVLTDGRLIAEYNKRIEKLEKQLNERALVTKIQRDPEIVERIEKLEDRIEYVWLKTEELNAEDLNIKKEISELLKEIFRLNDDSVSIELGIIKSVLKKTIMMLDDACPESTQDLLKQLDGEKDVEVSDLSADLKIPHSTEPYMGNGKGNSTSLQPKDSLTKFRDKVLEKFDEKPSSIIMKGRERWAGKGWIKKNILGIEEKPSEPDIIAGVYAECPDCKTKMKYYFKIGDDLIAEFLDYLTQKRDSYIKDNKNYFPNDPSNKKILLINNSKIRILNEIIEKWQKELEK